MRSLALVAADETREQLRFLRVVHQAKPFAAKDENLTFRGRA
jgi:hypothetical protein